MVHPGLGATVKIMVRLEKPTSFQILLGGSWVVISGVISPPI